MLKVGLTGGICSGKTTVGELLAARSCRVLHADLIAHELMTPGTPAYQEILRVFGKEILGPTGTIDRHRLGEQVFSNPEHLQELNRIVHPLVIEEFERELVRLERSDPTAIVVIEAALLIETGYERTLDKLIVTWCTLEQQRQRLLARGLTPAQVEARLAAQLPAETKRSQADYVIDCSGSLESTEAQVQNVYQELTRLAAGHAPAR